MKEALQALAKQPATFIGIASALLSQLMFAFVWMTGCDGMTNRTDRLAIGMVSEDSRMGETIVRNLKEGLRCG